jgi:hypothetical protein
MVLFSAIRVVTGMNKNLHVGIAVLRVIGEVLFLYGLLGWAYGVLVQIIHPLWLSEGLSHFIPWIRIDTFTGLSFILSIIGFFVWRLTKDTARFRTHAAVDDGVRAKPFPWKIVVGVLVGVLVGALIAVGAVLIVPRPVNPSPYTLFSDGFEPPETSSFQDWSGIQLSSGCTLEIQNSVVYAGTAAEHSILIAGQTYAFIYAKLASAVSSAFGSCYIYVRSGPSVNGDKCFLFGLYSMPEHSQVGVGLIYTGGVLRWSMDCNDGDIVDVVNSTIVSLNQWYYVEVSAVVASGTGSSVFYLNGVQVNSETGLNNWRVGNIAGTFVGIGNAYDGTASAEIYSDNVVVSTNYIPSQLATR